jgi:excisionase family DNA binding protein
VSANTTNLTSFKFAELLTTDQAAAYIDVVPGTLEVWRCTKRYHISFIKVGRLVRYRKSDLDSFLDKRTIEEKEK